MIKFTFTRVLHIMFQTKRDRIKLRETDAKKKKHNNSLILPV